MSISRFSFPTPITFGAGAIKTLPAALVKKSRPLVVTDRGIRGLRFLEEILTSLADAGMEAEVFADFEGNPVKQHVTKGVSAYHAHGADSLVIVGGGAALDVGKVIALMVNHPGDLFDYEDGKPDARPVDQEIPLIIAVPTTAGTGSEVGRSSVISDDQTKAKKIIFSPRILPQLVIADPELTLGLPPSVTAATGMDALTHCVEAYLAKGYHPICDGIALEGVRMIARALPTAVTKPKDVSARADMLAASMMGAIAFQKGLGLTHSCAHALSTVFDLHHGLANSLMIGACMEFNLPAAESKLATLAEVVGRGRKAEAFLQWLQEMPRQLGLPLNLKEVNVTLNERLLDVAEADICHPLGPRSVTREDFTQLYRAAGA